MRKRTKCLSIILLLAFALSFNLSSSFGVLKQNSSTEYLAQSNVGVNNDRSGLRHEESTSKYIPDSGQISFTEKVPSE